MIEATPTKGSALKRYQEHIEHVTSSSNEKPRECENFTSQYDDNALQFSLDTSGQLTQGTITQKELQKIQSVTKFVHCDFIQHKKRLEVIMDWNPTQELKERPALKEVTVYAMQVTKTQSLKKAPFSNLIVLKHWEVLIVSKGDSTKTPQTLDHRKLFWVQEMPPLDFEKLKLLNDDRVIRLSIPYTESNNQNDTGVASAISPPTVEQNTPVEPPKQTPVELPTTTIEVKCNVGFGNNLSLVGTGPGMTWGKGIPLKNINRDSWICEIKSDEFKAFEFKIMRNGKDYEKGSNHKIECGKKEVIVPKF